MSPVPVFAHGMIFTPGFLSQGSPSDPPSHTMNLLSVQPVTQQHMGVPH